MTTTPNRLQSHWGEVQLFLKSTWPRLTDVDLEETEGRYDRLIHKIKLLYGGGQEIQIEAGIKTKLQKYLNSLEV
jgi:hypothetical protein